MLLLDWHEQQEPYDYETIQKEASSIQSASSSVLCTHLATTSGALEKAARTNEPSDKVAELAKAMNEAHAKFETYLEDELDL